MSALFDVGKETILITGGSQGLGRQFARVLAGNGAAVVLAARQVAKLKSLEEEIRGKGGRAAAVQMDVTDAASITKAIDANMLTPIELIKATVDGMMARKFGRIVNITSSAVKAPIDILGLSNGARAGLTGFIAGLSRKTVVNNVTINALLPGPFETDRLVGTAKAESDKRGITPQQFLAERAKLNPAGRFGDPEEFGLACAFLCGAKAGFITGQNILLDGGAFPGTL